MADTPGSTYKNIGEILIEMGALDPVALKRALSLQGRRLGEILVDEQLADAALVAQALKIQAAQPSQAAPAAVRVPTQMLHALLEEFEHITESAGAADQSRVDDLKTQFEDLILGSARELLQRGADVVAETAKALGKDVAVEVKGGGFEVDLGLCAEFSDMLVHLARNAVIHGLESAEVRTAAGKPAQGRITLSLTVEKGYLVLRVGDDGAGIDMDAIARKAVTLGLAPAGKTLTPEALRQLLFTPGFSTADTVSLHAGRGIGLDVVEACVKRHKGKVDFVSKPGQGTLFEVMVPLTFARMAVLGARSAAQWIAVSHEQVRAMDLSGESEGRRHSFKKLFTEETPPMGTAVEEPYCLKDSNGGLWPVDEVSGPYRVFVRGVPSYIASNYGIAGTTRLPEPAVPAVFVDLDLIPKS